MLTAVAIAADKRETRIKLVSGPDQADAERLFAMYCERYSFVSSKEDYFVVIVKGNDSALPYLVSVTDPEDSDTILATRTSTIAGAVKAACSAMHIRFGE